MTVAMRDVQPDGDAICAICLEPAKDGALALECAHVYHETCIRTWLKHAPRCPQCAKPSALVPHDVNVCRGSISERMTQAEVQLRAAHRIMTQNDSRMQALLSQRSTFSNRVVDAARLQWRIDDAEAAARAAGDQLREIEAELSLRADAPSSPRSPRTPRSPYDHVQRPWSHASTRPRPPSQVGSRAPHYDRRWDRSQRTATQVVRAQMRVETRHLPIVVRPSRRAPQALTMPLRS